MTTEEQFPFTQVHIWRVLWLNGATDVYYESYQSRTLAPAPHPEYTSTTLLAKYYSRFRTNGQNLPIVTMLIPVHTPVSNMQPYNCISRPPAKAQSMDIIAATNRHIKEMLTSQNLEEVDTDIPSLPEETFWTDDMFWNKAGQALDNFFND
jgi:hypothetical protein